MSANEPSSLSDAARLRITLMDLDPAPWREVEVPLSMSFKGLHDAIQAAFLWFDMHLWEFDFAGRRYGPPLDDGFGDERVYKASNARLTKLRETATKSFLYESWKAALMRGGLKRLRVTRLKELRVG